MQLSTSYIDISDNISERKEIAGGVWCSDVTSLKKDSPELYKKYCADSASGLFIYALKKMSDRQNLQLNLSSGGDIYVIVEEESQLDLIINFKNKEVNSSICYYINENAHFSVLNVVDMNGGDIRTSDLVKQKKNSRSSISYFMLNGNFSERGLTVDLEGENAESKIQGFTLGRRSQNYSTSLTVNHRVPSCRSTQLFKAVVAEESKVNFHGKIVVHPNAQHTEAFQTNKSLLLSDTARVHTEPQLEIYADDVKCSHGAAVGQLDEDALFYMLSRGIGKTFARQLLLQGFAEDIILEVSNDDFREFIREGILKHLNTLN
ncbi:MAG: SufD family Fe-S cluster assembly protein [Prevotellaceae bacterium]|jgi:Fe-S cluster assembly protein SufD|nr:SufD family Fe-S cluster assembly protein [Prevotellaceae bacterium]